MEHSHEKNQQLILLLLQLLYQATQGQNMGENAALAAALKSTNLQVFELHTDGSLAMLPAGGRWGQTPSTPRQLLARLNCSHQWEAPLQAALEQAAQGQGGEMEVRTLDTEETWVQIQVEPLSAPGPVVAIGVIRVVTEEVRDRHRQEAAHQLLEGVLRSTSAGLEIAPEEDAWRTLWGWESYGYLRKRKKMSYTQMIRTHFLPDIHPRDREEFSQAMERQSLVRDFYTGLTVRSLDYRVKPNQFSDYEWHTIELSLFRDSATGQVKCTCLIRQTTQSRIKQLDEQRKLKEQEQDLLMRAKKLVESEDELDFVHVISHYYQGIYVVNLLDGRTRNIQVPEYFSDILTETGGYLSRTLDLYAKELVAPEYIPNFRKHIQTENLLQTMAEKGQVELTYQKKNGNWMTMRVLPMPGYTPETPKTLWIFEDETYTVRLRQEEEKARVTAQAAQAASQAKSQFLANMSHDIRTPLNAILGMSELGLREEDAEGKDNCLRDIRASGRILLENINSILDLSKIEAGKMEITPDNYRIQDVLHDTITVLSMHAQEKKLTFLAQVDENIPAVLFGDDVNISHIIMNLGSNAIKYTEQGSVTMTVTWEPGEETDGCLFLTMADTGVGIRQEDMPDIFRSYGRLDRGPNRRIEGTGLGLPICQNLAKLMHGEIGVESTYGAGSTFWVRLPQKITDPTPCGPYQGTQRRESDQRYNSFIAPEAVVLVVDDQPLNLKVIQGLLRPYEMEVYAARSGREALRQMTQVWPDLVLMDHMMPEMDGVEVTRRLREMGKKDPYFMVVPIVALTANAMKGMREYFLENGFNDFVSKPVELDTLDEILRSWVPEDKQKAPPRAATPGARQSLPKDLAQLEGLDVAQALSMCGSPEVYRKTLLLFREQIDGRVQRIQQALAERHPENYAIEVHSLKSAARWIGALELGDQAERLEMSARTGNWKQAQEETPALLKKYTALRQSLAHVQES